MRIASLIPPEDILLDVHIKDKSQALKMISEELSIDRNLDPERVRAALAAREALGSTGVGGGVALPHVSLEEVKSSIGLFIRPSPPIDFNSIDGKPVDLIFAILCPAFEKASAEKPLSILAALSRLLKNSTTARELRDARNVSSVCKILYRSDAVTANW